MRKNKVITQCATCSKSIELTPSSIRAGRKCCSHACSKKYVWDKPEYRAHMSLVHKGYIPTNLASLVEESRKTNGHRLKQLGRPAWNKGRRTSTTPTREGADYKNWRLAVYKRDNFKCRISSRDCLGRIEAHHILPWHKYENLRFEVNNGITLCHFHHPRSRKKETDLAPTLTNLITNYNG